jgi:hypothetical protein
MNGDDAKKLGVSGDELIELAGEGAAPLRAWVEIDPAVEAGTLPLDALAAHALGVGDSGRVRVRRLFLPEVA